MFVIRGNIKIINAIEEEIYLRVGGSLLKIPIDTR